MAVTIPRPSPEEAGGYGSLDRPGRRRVPAAAWIALAVVAVVIGAVIWWASSTGDGGSADPGTTTPAAPATTAPVTTAVPTTGPASTVAPPAGWGLGGELTGYVTAPRYYKAGTTEGDVEVAFVNSVIATARANANPTVEEPELTYWQTGLSLKATRDSQRILAQDGQVIVTGPLTRVEIEQVTLRSSTEAELRYCALLHDYNVVTANPADKVESLGTLEAVERLVRAGDGHWQSAEKIQTIQNLDGFGACLKAEAVPVTSGQSG